MKTLNRGGVMYTIAMAENNEVETVEVPVDQLSDYARAIQNPTPDAVGNLSKAEAVYFIDHLLTGDTPDGHPSDHNGNVTRSQVTEWAREVAELKGE